MIREEKTYIVACDCCDRDAEDLSKTSEPIAWRTREEAMEDWTDLECGPKPAPNGNALCWKCAEGVQA